MSAPVDVLAVLDRLAREVPMGAGHLRATAEARDAVAKLIGTAGGVLVGGMPVTVRERQEMMRRLKAMRAARDACVGGAA